MILERQNRIFGLDMMRAAAIILILFGDCIWFFPTDYNMMRLLMEYCSYFGIEVFFVLGGYLMGRFLCKTFTTAGFGITHVMNFLIRRGFRIIPNYILILIVNIFIAFLLGYEVRNALPYFFFAQNLTLPMFSFFPESWSLPIGVFASILLPFSLLFFASFQKSRSRIFALATLVLICIFMAAKLVHYFVVGTDSLEAWNSGIRMVVIYRLDSVFIGVLCGWMSFNAASWWHRTKYICAGLGVIMCGFFLVGVGKLQLTISNAPLFWDVFYLPLTSISIALFLPLFSNWNAQRSILVRGITAISMLSYSMYLLHFGVVLQLMKFLVSLEFASVWRSIVFMLIYLVVTLCLSWLLYHYFERKFTKLTA